MSGSSLEQKNEAKRALSVLSRDEQRALMHELELDSGAALTLALPPFGRVTIGNGALLGEADPQMRLMLLVILGLLIILVLLLLGYMVTLFLGKPFDEHLFTLMTALVGYLAGVITPKPTSSQARKTKLRQE